MSSDVLSRLVIEICVSDGGARVVSTTAAPGLGGYAGWVDQVASPLGRNVHCAAVRRRIAEAAQGADPGAAVTRSATAPRRRYLLSPAALREEVAREQPAPKPPRKARPREDEPAPDSYRARLLAKLRAVR